MLLVFVLLSGCRSSVAPWHPDEVPRLPHEVTGASDQTILSFEKRLTKQGVRVLSIGEDYMVSIPAKNLFGDQSPRLTWNSYPLLNDIACYLKQFRKVGVQVNAYTSQYASVRRERALSLARADAVANYLWSQGIDTRLLFAHGQGSEKPIIIKASKGDGSPNARIEITFRRAII